MEEQLDKPTVMSVSLKYGLISGIVGILITLIRTIVFEANPMDSDWKISVLSGIIGIAIIVFAHKEFKEKGDGYMSYGQGFGIGFLTTFISFILSSIILFTYVMVIDPSLYAEIWDKAEAQMREQGQSDEAIENGLSIARTMMWIFLVVGGAFFSAVLGAIVPIFTQKSNPQPGF